MRHGKTHFSFDFNHGDVVISAKFPSEHQRFNGSTNEDDVHEDHSLG